MNMYFYGDVEENRAGKTWILRPNDDICYIDNIIGPFLRR